MVQHSHVNLYDMYTYIYVENVYMLLIITSVMSVNTVYSM